MGMRLAVTSSRSQMRHPDGKKTLVMASPASASHPRTPRRRVVAISLAELVSATQAEMYSFQVYN